MVVNLIYELLTFIKKFEFFTAEMFDLCTISLGLPLIKSELESPPLSFDVLNESILANFLLKLL